MANRPADVDVISQLQNEVSALCAKLFNFLGALQRDAPPISVKGEGLLAPGGGADVESQTELMASELLASFKALEQLILHLPATDRAEPEQVEEIVALQRRNTEASQALQVELGAAEAQLRQLQDAFALLADFQLARRGQQAGAGTAGIAGGGAPL